MGSKKRPEPDVTVLKVRMLEERKFPGHPKASHYAELDVDYILMPQLLAGTVVEVQNKFFQVLGIKVDPPRPTGLALRRLLKVGKG